MILLKISYKEINIFKFLFALLVKVLWVTILLMIFCIHNTTITNVSIFIPQSPHIYIQTQLCSIVLPCVLCLALFCLSFYVSHLWNNSVSILSFWLTSLSIIFSNSIHIAANCMILFSKIEILIVTWSLHFKQIILVKPC